MSAKAVARPVTDAEVAKAVRILTAIGLDDYAIDCVPDPDRPGEVKWLGTATDLQLAWFMARELAQALGLIPEAEATKRPPRQASGWARQKAREVRKAAQA